MFSQQNYVMEYSPFQLSITDGFPLLTFDSSGNGTPEANITLFDNDDTACDFVEAYHNILIECMATQDGIDVDICIESRILRYLKQTYNIEYAFEEGGFDEFREHILARLAKMYSKAQAA